MEVNSLEQLEQTILCWCDTQQDFSTKELLEYIKTVCHDNGIIDELVEKIVSSW